MHMCLRMYDRLPRPPVAPEVPINKSSHKRSHSSLSSQERCRYRCCLVLVTLHQFCLYPSLAEQLLCEPSIDLTDC
jgi:hypothetical protein